MRAKEKGARNIPLRLWCVRPCGMLRKLSSSPLPSSKSNFSVFFLFVFFLTNNDARGFSFRRCGLGYISKDSERDMVTSAGACHRPNTYGHCLSAASPTTCERFDTQTSLLQLSLWPSSHHLIGFLELRRVRFNPHDGIGDWRAR